MTYVLILAGGRGERFWPLSRRNLPKQFISLSGKTSFLQDTFKRALSVAPLNRIYVITNKDHLRLIRSHLPSLKRKNIVAEPESKNTAACIGLASIILRKLDPDSLTVVMPSDHLIRSDLNFKTLIKKAIGLAKRTDSLILIGIKPTYPETGFGYLRLSKSADEGIYNVRQFIEKPSLKKAKSFIKNKNYAWNSGIFVWKTQTILSAIRKYLPRLYKGLEDMAIYLDKKGVERNIRKHYKSFENISIDKGVLEKSNQIKALVSNFFWCDVGSWRVFEAITPKDRLGNIAKGNFIGMDTNGCIIFSEDDHLVGTIGLRNLVIVKFGNATLVCPKEKTDQIRHLYGALRERKRLARFT